MLSAKLGVKELTKMQNRFIVGSTYFFNQYENFNSKDIDILLLVDNPIEFDIHRQTTLFNKKCVFEWKRMTADEFVKLTLKTDLPIQVGKFLIPEFNKEIGFTLEHLKTLEPIFNNLDDKHLYEKVIFDAYIANNDFTLTETQLEHAFMVYKEKRQSK